MQIYRLLQKHSLMTFLAVFKAVIYKKLTVHSDPYFKVLCIDFSIGKDDFLVAHFFICLSCFYRFLLGLIFQVFFPYEQDAYAKIFE